MFWLAGGSASGFGGGQTLLRPDILFCLIMLIAVVIYAFRHPDIDDWRGHWVLTETVKRHILKHTI